MNRQFFWIERMQYLYVSLYSVLRSAAAQLKVYLRMNAHVKLD